MGLGPRRLHWLAWSWAMRGRNLSGFKSLVTTLCEWLQVPKGERTTLANFNDSHPTPSAPSPILVARLLVANLPWAPVHALLNAKAFPVRSRENRGIVIPRPATSSSGPAGRS